MSRFTESPRARGFGQFQRQAARKPDGKLSRERIARAVVEVMEPRQLLSTSALISHVSTGPSDPNGTADTITIQQGQAVHVNSLGSFTGTTATEEQLGAQIQWSFGDVTGRYNGLTGFTAAHVYDDVSPSGLPYRVTLTVTDATGAVTRDDLFVTVVENTNRSTGRVIYVDAPGGGSVGSIDNTGFSETQPVETVEQANDIIAGLTSKDNISILFKRGDVVNYHESIDAAYNNVRIGAYGEGTHPILTWDTSAVGDFIINSAAKSHLLIENVAFESTVASGRRTGVFVYGNDVIVRNCKFVRVLDGVKSRAESDRLLVMDNESTTLSSVSAYGFWCDGSDQVYLGNTILNSVGEHAFRTGYVNRLLIAHNSFANPLVSGDPHDKGTFEIQGADDAYVVNNDAPQANGGFRVGPRDSDNYADSVVFEANSTNGSGMSVFPGTANVIFRSNVVRTSDQKNAFSFGSNSTWSGPGPQYYRNVSIINNTNYASGIGGDFLFVELTPENVVVKNNLQVAPNRTTGFAVWARSGSLNGLTFDRNVFAPRGSNPAIFQIGISPFTQYDLNSSTPAADWNALAAVGTDAEISATSSGITSTNLYPTLGATPAVDLFGAAVSGVTRDFYGRSFADGDCSVGAVEARSPVTGRHEAEGFDAGGSSGIVVGYGASGYGIQDIGAGDYALYRNVDFGAGGITTFTASLAVPPPNAGRTFGIRIGTPTGTQIGTLTPTSTGSWTTFQEQTFTLSSATAVTGVQNVYIYAIDDGACNLDYFTFSTAPVSSYTSSDIGSSVATGSTTVVTPDTGFNVTGGGLDILGTSDSFRYVHKQLAGDFDVMVKVESLPGTLSEWTKAGLMARSTLAADSANAFVMTTPDVRGTRFSGRATAGATTPLTTAGATLTYPNVWLRLKRVGNVFTGYSSADGTNWGTAISSVTITAAPGSMYLGMAVTAHGTASDLVTAQFRNLQDVVSTPTYTSNDIGSSVAAGGSTTAVVPGSDYDITGGGTDVTGTADSFRFVHTQLTGDFDVKVRMQSVPSTISHWSKVGLMARTGTAANAANAFMFTTPGGNGMRFQGRASDGGGTSISASGGTASFPNQWLRLQRIGNTFYGYRSTDGVTWGTALGSVTIASSPTTMYVGMAVCAHGSSTDLLSTQFRDLEIA